MLSFAQQVCSESPNMPPSKNRHACHEVEGVASKERKRRIYWQAWPINQLTFYLNIAQLSIHVRVLQPSRFFNENRNHAHALSGLGNCQCSLMSFDGVSNNYNTFCFYLSTSVFSGHKYASTNLMCLANIPLQASEAFHLHVHPPSILTVNPSPHSHFADTQYH